MGINTGQTQKEYGLRGWRHEKVKTKETASQTQVHHILCRQHGHSNKFNKLSQKTWNLSKLCKIPNFKKLLWIYILASQEKKRTNQHFERKYVH